MFTDQVVPETSKRRGFPGNRLLPTTAYRRDRRIRTRRKSPAHARRNRRAGGQLLCPCRDGRFVRLSSLDANTLSEEQLHEIGESLS